ncbi:MAG: methyltransferase domain-containing protein [Microbacter sp.]
MKPKTTPFDLHLDLYEAWFEENRYAYLSEIEAIKKVWQPQGNTMEIGVGSGLFALPLSVHHGIEPSLTMRQKAVERGIEAVNGVAESLPYDDASLDSVLMVTTICFVNDPLKTLQEAFRVLKSSGNLVIAFVDKDSPVGQQYLHHKEESLFYKEATFFGVEEIRMLLQQAGFRVTATYQTIFKKLDQLTEIDKPKPGFGKGSFVVINACKQLENLRIAFAVNDQKMLPHAHFGDAPFFEIYQWSDHQLKYVETAQNNEAMEEKEHPHGDDQKGNKMVDLLLQHRVNVLVSRQFGKNITIIQNHFLPVLVNNDMLEEAKIIVTSHFSAIADSLIHASTVYKPLSLRS